MGTERFEQKQALTHRQDLQELLRTKVTHKNDADKNAAIRGSFWAD
jgi:hypothetical protein